MHQIHNVFCLLVDRLNIKGFLLYECVSLYIMASSENFPEINKFSKLSMPFLADNKVLTSCEMLHFIMS
jgi:hypothetical protein